MIKKLFIAPLLGLFLFGGNKLLARSAYNYTLDPAHAEEILARLAGRTPILENEWLNILGEKKAEQYKVRLGDNLWIISKRLFGNAFLWRKLWQVNPTLSNPHELNAGAILQFYQAGASRGLASEDEGVIRIPLIKLTPASQNNKYIDLNDDSIINTTVKDRFMPSFLVLTDAEKIYGEISGSYTNADGIMYHDILYVEAASETLTPGETYTVVHEAEEIVDRTQIGLPTIGTLCRVVGKLQIVEEGESLLRAQILELYGIVNRGDKLIAVQKSVSFDVSLDPPNELQTRIVMGSDSQMKMFGQGQTVLLNKGTNDGMQQGFIFRVWHDTDPITGSKDDVEPHFKGEVRIIYAGPVSSLGYIIRNTEPFYIGDTLVPRQAFSNPLPLPLNRRRLREID